MSLSSIAKFNMIEQQIRPWEVLDHRVLAVLDEVDREAFVADAYKGLAYADCQIPIAVGVRMLPPTIEGRMLQSLAIEPGDRVLEVGSGSGYLAACFARLGGRVTSIDSSREIIDLAGANLASLGGLDVELAQRSIDQLDASDAYDVIAVTGSLAEIPLPLKQALKPGGRMFLVTGHSPVMQARLVTRVGDEEWISESLFETDLPRLRV